MSRLIGDDIDRETVLEVSDKRKKNATEVFLSGTLNRKTLYTYDCLFCG